MPRTRNALLLSAVTALTAVMAGDSVLLAQAPATVEDPTDNPYLRLSSPTNWEFRREIYISPATFTDRGPGGARRSFTDRIVLQELTVVAPLITGCATAVTNPEALTEGSVKIDHNVVVEEPVVVPGFANGEQLARWDLQAIDTRRLAVSLKGPAITYQARVNEELALGIPWPQTGYPETIAEATKPQPFIESNDPRVVRLMKSWTNNNPQGPNPYLFAKAIAGRVVESFQPTGSDFRFDHTTRFAGVETVGAAEAVKNMRGSDSDMAAVLCAIYRAAGLPARVVVGLDVAGSPGGRANVPAPNGVCRANFDPNAITHPLLRTWVEFYLYDEANNVGGWIPVDIQMIRLSSSRMQQLDREWDGFGGGMCYDHLLPITFHFVPPMTAGEDGLPSLWGWLTTPDATATETEVVIEAAPSVKRGGRR